MQLVSGHKEVKEGILHFVVFVCSMNNLKPGVMESIACRSGMRGRTSAGQVMQKCTSSSTAPLHNLHILWSGGIPTYLPVSISSGAVPPLSHATTDHCVLHHILSIYSSGSYLSLKVAYVLSFGLAITSVFNFSLSDLNRQHETTFLNSLWFSPFPQGLFCHQGRRLHSAKVHLTSDAQFLICPQLFCSPLFVICNAKITMSASYVFAWWASNTCLLQLLPESVFSQLPRKICKLCFGPFPSLLSSSIVTKLKLYSQTLVPQGNHIDTLAGSSPTFLC